KYQIDIITDEGTNTKKFQIRLHSQNVFQSSVANEGQTDKKTEIAAVASNREDVATFDTYQEALEIRNGFAHMLKRHRTTSEGFYEVEATLLQSHAQWMQPPTDDSLRDLPPVPTAAAVYFIFPDWPSRFQSEGFKEVLNMTIHKELPAHLRPYILFFDGKEMYQFEELYICWLEEMHRYHSSIHTQDAYKRSPELQQASDQLQGFLNEIIRQKSKSTKV
ncbi:MAG: hypothetical protein AAFR59_12910, partial [Bacteroidota bacterium]